MRNYAVSSSVTSKGLTLLFIKPDILLKMSKHTFRVFLWKVGQVDS